MGVLLKIILFGLVFYYIMKTVGGFIFRIMGGQVQQNQRRYSPPPSREGEINIDHAQKGKKGKSGGNAKEGEYIDYEEIK